MHIPLITGFYAGLLGLLLFVLTARVGRVRSRVGIPLLDGGNQKLAVAMRQQGNFVDLVPMCLILLAIMEMAATSIYALHILGIVLVISRLIHPFGIRFDTMNTGSAPQVPGARCSYSSSHRSGQSTFSLRAFSCYLSLRTS